MSARTLLSVVVGGALILLLAPAATVFAQGSPRVQPPTGASMYQAYCAPCHGRKGAGDGPVASSLKVKPTDLTRLSKGNAGTFPSERMGMVLLFGVVVPTHGTTDMPVWGSRFRAVGDEKSAQERVAAISAHIQTLQLK